MGMDCMLLPGFLLSTMRLSHSVHCAHQNPQLPDLKAQCSIRLHFEHRSRAQDEVGLQLNEQVQLNLTIPKLQLQVSINRQHGRLTIEKQSFRRSPDSN